MALYTVKQASKMLQVNSNKVYDLINKGLIVPLKLGRLKIPDYELERFIKDNQGKDLNDLDNIKDLS